MNNINVIIKRPGEDPCMASVPNTLEALLGPRCYLQRGRAAYRLAAKLQGCQLGFCRRDRVAGVDGDEFADVPCDLETLGRAFVNWRKEGETK